MSAGRLNGFSSRVPTRSATVCSSSVFFSATMTIGRAGLSAPTVGALNPALPIVMVAEKKTELEQTVAERVGTRLEKPFSLPALIQAIHLLLGQPAQNHRQATGSGPISNHLCPFGRTASQPAPPWRARQETATKQTYETESATGGRRQ